MPVKGQLVDNRDNLTEPSYHDVDIGSIIPGRVATNVLYFLRTDRDGQKSTEHQSHRKDS